MRTILLILMLFSFPAFADGDCGIRFTLEGFQAAVKAKNPGLVFVVAQSTERPSQAGYYYLKSTEINPNDLATLVLVEHGCVNLVYVKIGEVK